MSTIFLEAFGQLSDSPTIDSREECLYSVFRERAELMRWGTTSKGDSLLWSMEEAEITSDTEPYRIGWVQVGMDIGRVDILSTPANPDLGRVASPIRQRSINLPMALPALVQCFSDALGRFGVVELSGIQLTASYLNADAQSCTRYLVSVLNWFNMNLKAEAEAILAFDQGLLEAGKVSELVAELRYRNTYPFEFRTLAAVPDKHKVKVPVDDMPLYPASPQLDTGVFVTLPEWMPSAAGWVLASVIDAAQLIQPGTTDFAIRVTRVR